MNKESIFTKQNSIPRDFDFEYRQQCLATINGWFSPASHGLFSFYLDFQNKHNINGNLGEIGVWEGKSASVISSFPKTGEHIYLIDPLIKKNAETIYRNIDMVCRKIPDNLNLNNCLSENFLNNNTESLRKSFRFFHIDGCHTGTNVYSDLELADVLLHEDSILVVDDFFNPSYPQITEALYKYLFLNPYKFRLFFNGFNKAYLCRPGKYSFYYSYTFENLQKEMLSKGMAFTIKKTSSIGDSYTLSAEEYQPQVDSRLGYLGPDWEPDIIDCIERRSIFD